MEYSISQNSPLNLSYVSRCSISMPTVITQWQLRLRMFKSELGSRLQRKKNIKVNDNLGLQSYHYDGNQGR